MKDLEFQPDTKYPFEKRDRDHHDGFCDFLADLDDRAKEELDSCLERLDYISQLEAADIPLLPYRLRERETLIARQSELEAKRARISNALCLANEFMNV